MLVVATSDGIRVGGGARDWRTELAGHDVTAVVPEGATLWALVDDHDVWQRSPVGTWAKVATSGEKLTCLVPTPSGPLLGTAGAELGRVVGPGRIESIPTFGNAPTRDEWYTPSGGPAAVRSMAVAGDGTWFVNVHVGGILRSRDGGSSWSATIDLHADVHQVLCPRVHQPGLVLAATADGLAISRDGGDSWRLRDGGLSGTYCRAAAVHGDTVVLSASEGHRGEKAGVYRSTLDGWARFQGWRVGLPASLGGNVDTGWLSADRGQVAIVDAAGDVLTSSLDGSGWTQVAQGFLNPHWLSWA